MKSSTLPNERQQNCTDNNGSGAPKPANIPSFEELKAAVEEHYAKWGRYRSEWTMAQLTKRASDITAFLNRTKQQMHSKGIAGYEIDRKIDEMRQAIQATFSEGRGGLNGKTWKELEVGREFARNDRIELVKDSIVVGVDVGKTQFSVRLYDDSGKELGDCKAHFFDNNIDGMWRARTLVNCTLVAAEKKQVILGLEPTGHYWYNMYHEFQSFGYTVVTVNPHHV